MQGVVGQGERGGREHQDAGRAPPVRPPPGHAPSSLRLAPGPAGIVRGLARPAVRAEAMVRPTSAALRPMARAVVVKARVTSWSSSRPLAT